MPNLYLISQDSNNNYDTYDSAIVSANSVEEAKHMTPDGDAEYDYTWTAPENVSVELIGTTHLPTGVVLSSFNAG